MRIAIAVLAKTPGLTPAKTRLAASIGADGAESFYLRCLAATRECLDQFAGASVPAASWSWAIAEDNGVGHPAWGDDRHFWTGPGDFGQRLGQVWTELLGSADGAILLGTDTPQLRPADLTKAVEWLTCGADFAVGPALDGGFYLLAGKQALPIDLWRSITYSNDQTCEQLIARLAPLGRIELLRELRDVDELDDLGDLARLESAGAAAALENVVKFARDVMVLRTSAAE